MAAEPAVTRVMSCRMRHQAGPIAGTFPLEDWRTAMEISLTGQARGKLEAVLAGLPQDRVVLVQAQGAAAGSGRALRAQLAGPGRPRRS